MIRKCVELLHWPILLTVARAPRKQRQQFRLGWIILSWPRSVSDFATNQAFESFDWKLIDNMLFSPQL